MHTLLCEGKKCWVVIYSNMGKEIGGEITQPNKKLYPQTKPTWPSFPPTFLPPFLRVQPDVTTLMKVYLNSLEKHSTEWLLSCSRVPLCWSTAHKSQERCGFNRTNLSASFIWWKKGGCADRWLRTVERGLPQLQPVFGFFICTSYIFPFKACQKGHETEHFGSEKSVKTCYYLIISYFY